MSHAADSFARFGVTAARVDAVRAALQPVLGDAAPALLAQSAAAADPALALAGIERLLDADGAGAFARLEAADVAALIAVLGSSQPLTTTVVSAGSGWTELIAAQRRVTSRTPAEHARVLAGVDAAPWEELLEQIRCLRNREYLRIGIADLTRRFTVEQTMAELSALAAGVFMGAIGWVRRSLEAQYGRPAGGDEVDAFVVLALGKLGGWELNYSSDVDVMYLYAADSGATGGGTRGCIEAREFYARMAELVTRALQEVTPAGFAFRVDLRLRPEGVNGPIVNSLDNALLYYGSYGQTWERTALIQARPIAGREALGERFIAEIRPFVYRRYLDYATVADMKQMKARVEAELGDEARRNVKLGRGGIREIEFLVQVMQLIHAGRDERLRGRGSLAMLRRIVDCGYLPAAEGEALVAAYRFLRDVEHKIQIVSQRQTHSLPVGEREQEALARRLGFTGSSALADMRSALDRHAAAVRRAFEKLFYEPAAETRRAGAPAVVQLLQQLDDRNGSIARLAALGFAQPEERYGDLLLLREGPPGAPARARRKQALYELAPALLATILKAADPDLALRNLATFISSVGARTSFLALLRENPGTLRMLVTLFGGSQFLANAFIRRPELLDTLVRADLVRVHRDARELSAELAALLPAGAALEDALDVLRRFRNQEFLRIGINDLQGGLTLEEVSTELTYVAEACLDAACTIAARDVCARYAVATVPGHFAVLGMGKLGSGELNYNSDLDLIFIYDGAEPDTSRLGHELFSKLGQRLITVLQTTTREGIAYRIDTRLRPSGRSGPLVSSLAGFRAYHEHSAQLWERQALIKARPVAGDAALGRALEHIVSAFVYRAPLAAAEVQEIRRLRQRMETELAREDREHINIKTGRGGLIDIEFLTQTLQLHYGAAEPRVRQRATVPALQALHAAGVLDAADTALLTSGYRFLRRVENALRLAHDRPVEDLDRRRLDLGAVAKRLGYEGAGAADALWQEYELRRERIRACYEGWFERMVAPAP